MHIYIDESGIFSNPADKESVFSCVSALVIPSSQQEAIFQEFQQLSSKWPAPKRGKEIKGSGLDENQISQVVPLLQQYDTVLDTVAIDLGCHTDVGADLIHVSKFANI